MKKKFKLFATIGSLCLAVAMMTIGVLAATQATLTVSSNVIFTTESVKVKFDAQVVYGEHVTYTADATPGETYSADAATRKNTWTVSYETTDETADANWKLGEYKFSDSAQDETVVYTFKITNLGSNPAKVDVTTAVTEVLAEANKAGTIVVTTDGNAASLGANEVYTYTVTVTLNDATMDWGTNPVNAAFKVTKA